MKKQYVIIPAIILVVLIAFIACPSSQLSVIPDIIGKPQKPVFKKTILKVYIENSGSMDGYMCQGSELKDAVKGYVNSIKTNFSEVELYYINSQIIPRPNDLKSFVSDLTPLSFARAGGNRGNTDMGDLIEKVLDQTNDSTVSIFVSDCILDVPENPTKHFYDKQIDIAEAVKNYIKKKDNAIQIIRLMSSFNGIYYGVEGYTEHINEKRPYYIWVMGPNYKLAEMNVDSPVKEIIHGVDEWISFTKEQTVIANEITNESGGKPIKLKADLNGNYNIKVKVNFNSLLKSEEFIKNISNYKFYESPNINVEKVKKLVDDSKYSHELKVSISKTAHPSEERLLVVKSKDLPAWVEKKNDDTGRDVLQNLEKTTGIKYLIQGVAKGFEKEENIGSIKIKFKNK